ncbi:dehydrogenase [Ignicoccus pacificus DSM 13166]|uniref:Dehydrogenase n=1 Tax=Ignicoccus pacificus DSM 13166 TaxID=940294 RepID=A0A977PJB6_9CREN|nr:dehydrogenase [Ignicoccus pacificus DSM 13166]
MSTKTEKFVEVRGRWRLSKGASGLVRSLLATAEYFFKSRPTTLYPYEKNKLPEAFRGVLTYDIEKCIGCGACILACPNNCLYRRSGPKTDKNKPGVYIAFEPTHCLFCGLCVDACPPVSGALSHSSVISIVSSKKKVMWEPWEWAAFTELIKEKGWEYDAVDYDRVEPLIKRKAEEIKKRLEEKSTGGKK